MLIMICAKKIKSDDLIRSGIEEYATLLGMSLPKYTIVREDNKKPILKPDFLKFNISHSFDYTILAVSNKEVGIDIQYHKEIDYSAIEKRFFHEKQSCYNKKQFYDLWSMKEARLKRNGDQFLIDGLKNNNNQHVQLLNAFKDYSIAVDSEDKNYLLMFKF